MDIENLIMLRPTKSPIKYAQMRERGSRLCPKIGDASSARNRFELGHCATWFAPFQSAREST